MRINAYINGFNLYYAIKKLKNPSLKWLDLKKLCENYLKEPDRLLNIYLFTALLKLDPADPNQRKRQKIYLDAQQSRGIKVILGRFKKKINHLGQSRMRYWAWILPLCKKLYARLFQTVNLRKNRKKKSQKWL